MISKVKQIIEDGLEIDDIIRRAKSSSQLSDCNDTDYRYKIIKYVEDEMNIIIKRRQYISNIENSFDEYLAIVFLLSGIGLPIIVGIHLIITDLMNLSNNWTIAIIIIGTSFIIKKKYEKIEFDKNDFAEKAFVDGVKTGSRCGYIATYLDLLYRLENNLNIDWIKNIK